MAFEAGALARGQWSGRHSTPISNEWPDFADRKRTDKSNRLSYPFGVMLNRSGRRFVDEGEDLGLYTYAKYGGGDPSPAGVARVADIRPEDDASPGAPLPDERFRSPPIPSRSWSGSSRLTTGARRSAPSRHTTRRRATPTVSTRPPSTGSRRPESIPPSRTGRSGSTTRRLRPTPRPAGSPSRSGASRSTSTPGCSARTGVRSRGSTPAARWSEGFSTSTTRGNRTRLRGGVRPDRGAVRGAGRRGRLRAGARADGGRHPQAARRWRRPHPGSDGSPVS